VDVLTLALACSLYPDQALVRTLITDASHGNPFFVGDTVKLDTYDNSSSLQDAQQIIQRLTKAGGRPAVGLMGLPLAWAGRFGKTTDVLFDGCTNVSIGTAMLKQFEQQCRQVLEPAPQKLIARRRQRPRPPLSAEQLRPCVLGHFGRELGIAKFAEGIMSDIPRSSIASEAAMSPQSRETPSWRGPGLFFDVPDQGAEEAPAAPSVGAAPKATGGEAAVIR
jgi:hypothetical protein